MTATELAQEFLRNKSKMEKYHQAIDLLREAGFETVLRRLGEPTTVLALDHPRHAEISAFEHAEKRGWFQMLDFLFDFAESMAMEVRTGTTGDYGAKELLQKLGYSNEVINAIEEDNNA